MLAAPGEPALLDAWVGAQGSAVVAAGGTEPPIWATAPPLADLVARAAAGGALSAAAGLVSSPPAVAQAMLSPGDLTVAVPSFGAGVLVVDGALRIEAPLTFTGVVAATGGVYVEATGAFVLQGALWLGAGGLEALVVEGSASMVASAAGLESADALLPLPRRARVASVRDF
jgi:hypothetical protein